MPTPKNRPSHRPKKSNFQTPKEDKRGQGGWSGIKGGNKQGPDGTRPFEEGELDYDPVGTSGRWK